MPTTRGAAKDPKDPKDLSDGAPESIAPADVAIDGPFDDGEAEVMVIVALRMGAAECSLSADARKQVKPKIVQ